MSRDSDYGEPTFSRRFADGIRYVGKTTVEAPLYFLRGVRDSFVATTSHRKQWPMPYDTPTDIGYTLGLVTGLTGALAASAVLAVTVNPWLAAGVATPVVTNAVDYASWKIEGTFRERAKGKRRGGFKEWVG